MVNIAPKEGRSKGCPDFQKSELGSPVSGGVPESSSGQAVTPSQASGKVANCEVRTEVSQTAVSVLTNRNYIPRPSGRMRYHMLPKSKASKEECTEVRTERKENIQWIFLVTGRVAGSVAAIGTGIFTLPREILE